MLFIVLLIDLSDGSFLFNRNLIYLLIVLFVFVENETVKKTVTGDESDALEVHEVT
jgi:hypothetical protein